MQLAFGACAYFVGLVLDVLVVTALLRSGSARRYPFLLVYVIVDFATTLIEVPSGLSLNVAQSPDATRLYAALYWWNERIIQVLVFLIVISLVYRATEQWKPLRKLLAAMVVATLAIVVVSFVIHYRPGVSPGVWMTPVTRDLNFCAAILDLGLWGLLIRARQRDYKLLMVSGALGIAFTAGAIGQAFRGMSRTPGLVLGDLIYLANLACLYIWWQAFRPAPVASGNAGVRPEPHQSPALSHPRAEQK
ncbi:MAG TPA: hypothetical protein VMH28_26595 [Candidatus Acidoferrales bacterium]|nr:hypothetical protein [Candidatus Acidoferrales bacterium]